jgi:hypothetical protein
MTASKAICVSSLLLVLLASPAEADTRGPQAASAPDRSAMRPHSRHEAVATAQRRRLQRQQTAGAWRGRELRSSQHGMRSPNPRS